MQVELSLRDKGHGTIGIYSGSGHCLYILFCRCESSRTSCCKQIVCGRARKSLELDLPLQSNIFFKIAYRLTLPGSLLVIMAAALIKIGVITESDSPFARFAPLAFFLTGLALCAVFRRSRIFFA